MLPFFPPLPPSSAISLPSSVFSSISYPLHCLLTSYFSSSFPLLSLQPPHLPLALYLLPLLPEFICFSHIPPHFNLQLPSRPPLSLQFIFLSSSFVSSFQYLPLSNLHAQLLPTPVAISAFRLYFSTLYISLSLDYLTDFFCALVCSKLWLQIVPDKINAVGL